MEEFEINENYIVNFFEMQDGEVFCIQGIIDGEVISEILMLRSAAETIAYGLLDFLGKSVNGVIDG